MANYPVGYVDVPGKGKRWSDGKGGLFHNQFGPSLNQTGNFFRGVRSWLPGGESYTEYYNGVADNVGT